MHVFLSGLRQHWLRRTVLVIVAIALFGRGDFAGQAQEKEEQQAARPPLGRFLTISSPVDATVYGRVSRAATALQSQAREENRKGILVLEITDGPSRFGDVRELALFLSTELPSVTTVAWIPRDVRGYNVILALACNEIVMHPKASLGDIGRGKPVEPDAQSFVVNLANRRHNTKLSEALVQGMMDPKREVIWVQLQTGEPPNVATETRVVSPTEFDRLVRSKAVISEHKTVKAPGTDGVFSGAQARALNLLVTQTAEDRPEVASIYQLPRESIREDPTFGNEPKARRIRLAGEIRPMTAELLSRQVNRAVADGVNLIVLEIDSPGGHLGATQHVCYQLLDLDPKQVRVVAYVPEMALSGAAMIALACDDIYMHPRAMIGDAAPIEVRPGQPFERADEKQLSLVREFMETLAREKGRPAALAVAMADKDLKVYRVTNSQTGDIWYMSDAEIHASNGEWVKGPLVDESRENNLLTVDGARANVLKLAEPPVRDFDELKTRLGLSPETNLPPIGPNWVDTLVFILNSSFVTGLLFVIGIACIYAELHFTTGMFGIFATICFALFFWSRFLGGTADWLEVILFLIGLGCIAIEVLLIPGFGVFGVSGGLLVIASLILASQTFVIPTSKSDYDALGRSMGTLSGAILGFIVVAAILGRYLPRMPLLNHMVLVPPGAKDPNQQNEPQLRPEIAGGYGYSPLDGDQSLVGRNGTAVTILRPAGKARIDDRIIDVVSDGPFIEQGATVQVIEVLGNRIVVRQV